MSMGFVSRSPWKRSSERASASILMLVVLYAVGTYTGLTCRVIGSWQRFQRRIAARRRERNRGAG